MSGKTLEEDVAGLVVSEHGSGDVPLRVIRSLTGNGPRI